MALCRCEKEKKPISKKNQYTIRVEPIGYPETSSTCGIKNCLNPGLIWLTKEEEDKYNEEDERFFNYASAVSKVKVK
ncbi:MULTISPECIES: hypothetical protein [unclassified Flavobacterium]|jgi:hypothetical protein|uniref:hypothetical protein n=1 Tax=unclassified Flavobacterium TaxID=196869 RepID=UPI0025C49D9B|nr:MULTISPECIES: hypothetical protein [unclassified Flavobacterium]